MLDITLEDLLREHLHFLKVSGNEWNMLYCEVCGDGEGRTKGPRGGWKFEGEFTSFHCFNCGVTASFNPEWEHPYSKDMWRVLEAFGIPKREHTTIAYKNKLKDGTFVKPIKKEISIDIIKIPDHFYKLNDSGIENIIAQKARKFLWEEKRIKASDYDFFLSTGTSKEGPKENAIARALINKLIIPFFKDEKMIYYQARDLDKKKYMNPAFPRTSVIYGFDKLTIDIQKPLYVTEGFWDAFHLDGVCVLENRMTTNQIEILNKSPRRKILVPDKKDDSKKLASQAIELGWEVGLPDIGECEDVTDAILTYGKIYVANSINNNIFSGYSATINLELY